MIGPDGTGMPCDYTAAVTIATLRPIRIPCNLESHPERTFNHASCTDQGSDRVPLRAMQYFGTLNLLTMGS